MGLVTRNHRIEIDSPLNWGEGNRGNFKFLNKYNPSPSPGRTTKTGPSFLLQMVNLDRYPTKLRFSSAKRSILFSIYKLRTKRISLWYHQLWIVCIYIYIPEILAINFKAKMNIIFSMCPMFIPNLLFVQNIYITVVNRCNWF